MSLIKKIVEALDNTFEKPVDQWTQKEISIYQLLQKTLEKYKVPYSLTQFNLDVRDIKRNVKKSSYFQSSKHQKSLNWCLEQLVIKSYQHSRKSGRCKVVFRLTRAGVKVDIQKEIDSEFEIKVDNGRISTTDTDNLDKMTIIFGINPEILAEHRLSLIRDFIWLIKEIGYFYLEE